MCGVSYKTIAEEFMVNAESVRNWVKLFNEVGDVEPAARKKTSRYPATVLSWILDFCEADPCFYLDELQDQIRLNFPNVHNVSIPTLCRALRFDLGLRRKRLTRRAIERCQYSRRNYWIRLTHFYHSSSQLVFLDESSKDGRDARRLYGRAARGKPALANLPDSRGQRYSALAFMDETGFLDWCFIEGTFTRRVFHAAVLKRLLPLLNPYPGPRSIVIMDNASIHRYPELIVAINSRVLVFPFCPRTPRTTTLSELVLVS